MPPLKIFGGSLFAYDVNGNDFALETTYFALQFSLGVTSGIPLPLSPQTGTSIDCSASLAGQQTLHTGYADCNQHLFVPVWYDGDLEIVAGTVLVPSLPATPISLQAPFTISGTLTVFKSDPSASPPPAPWFHHKVDGAGQLTVRLTAPIGSARTVTSYFYQFT